MALVIANNRYTTANVVERIENQHGWRSIIDSFHSAHRWEYQEKSVWKSVETKMITTTF